MQRIFRAAKEGDGPGKIARQLNASGIKPAHAEAWSRQTIAKLLRNPAYKGERYCVKNMHERIVSVQLSNAVNQAATTAKRRGSSSSGADTCLAPRQRRVFSLVERRLAQGTRAPSLAAAAGRTAS